MSKTKVSVTPQTAANYWADGMVQKIPKMQANVRAITVHPGEKAIANKTKMMQNWTAAMNSGKWDKNIVRQTLAEWKEITAQKMAERIPGGVDKAKPKYVNAMTTVFANMNQILPEIAGMANFTIEDSVNRAATYMRKMHEMATA
jgi:hypothetical protein